MGFRPKEGQQGDQVHRKLLSPFGRQKRPSKVGIVAESDRFRDLRYSGQKHRFTEQEIEELTSLLISHLMKVDYDMLNHENIREFIEPRLLHIHKVLR